MAAVEHLCSETGIDWMTAKIIRLEYGWNFKVNDPLLIANSLLSYKAKEFTQMVSSKRTIVYGSQRGGDEFYLKGYDKGLEAWITAQQTVPHPIFRWEKGIIDMTHLRNRINPIPVYTLEDLFLPSIASMLMRDLRASYEQTIKTAELDYQKLSNCEIDAVSRYKDKAGFGVRMERNPRSANNIRRAAEKAIKKATVGDDYLNLNWPTTF